MIQEALHEVMNNRDLKYDMAKGVMKEIMSGEASPVQMATYLTALRMKGETITEVTASAQVMREMATHLCLRLFLSSLRRGFRWQSMGTAAYRVKAGQRTCSKALERTLRLM